MRTCIFVIVQKLLEYRPVCTCYVLDRPNLFIFLFEPLDELLRARKLHLAQHIGLPSQSARKVSFFRPSTLLLIHLEYST